MFSNLPYRYFTLSVTFILLCATAINLAWSKILLFGKELICTVRDTCICLSFEKFEKEALENVFGKGEKDANQNFLQLKQNFLDLTRYILLFSSGFDLDKSESLSTG